MLLKAAITNFAAMLATAPVRTFLSDAGLSTTSNGALFGCL